MLFAFWQTILTDHSGGAPPPRTECLSAAPDRDHLVGVWGSRRCAELRPCLGQLPTLREHVTAPISGLDLVADDVRQRHFPNLARESGQLGAPIGERRTETMCRQLVPPHAAQQH